MGRHCSLQLRFFAPYSTHHSVGRRAATEEDLSRSRIAILVCVAIVTSAATLYLLRSDRSPEGSESAGKLSPVSARNAEGQSSNGPPDAPSQIDVGPRRTGGVPAEPPSAPTLRQRFLGSNDYDEFVGSIIKEAETGNIDAQYYVYAALSYCDREFRAIFRRRNGSGWLTLDEALQRVVRKQEQSIEIVQAIDQRCRKLIEPAKTEYADAGKWLRLAATGGQPLALTALAESRLYDLRIGTRSEDATKPKEAFDSLTAKELLMTALKSKEPEVLWKIGELQGMLSGSSENSTQAQWAWWLAACERGYECGPGSAWLESNCRYIQCQPGDDAVDLMKSTLQTDFPAVEELAHKINANIDAGAWSELPVGG